jgi:hypothetical protein
VAAISAIANIDPEPKQLISELTQRFSSYKYDYPAMLSDVLENIGEAAVAELIPVLSDKNPGRRRFAAWALGKFGPTAQSATPQLVALLKDPDFQIQRAAIDAVVQIGPSARNEVRRLLTDSDESIREAAQQVLDQTAGELSPDFHMP